MLGHKTRTKQQDAIRIRSWYRRAFQYPSIKLPGQWIDICAPKHIWFMIPICFSWKTHRVIFDAEQLSYAYMSFTQGKYVAAAMGSNMLCLFNVHTFFSRPSKTALGLKALRAIKLRTMTRCFTVILFASLYCWQHSARVALKSTLHKNC